MKKLIAIMGLTLSLAACSEQGTNFTTSRALPPKIGLNVQSITLTDRSGLQPATSPYNNNHFSPSISDAIRQWASDRLQATGVNGAAIIVIKRASLDSQALQTEHGVNSWFKRQQGVRYVARAEVTIEANGPSGFASADAIATRAITLPEDPSPIEKQDAYFTLLNDLMKDLGQNLEAAIQTHMGSFVTSSVYSNTAVAYEGAQSDPSPVIIQSAYNQSPSSAQDHSLASVATPLMPNNPVVYGSSVVPTVPDVITTNNLIPGYTTTVMTHAPTPSSVISMSPPPSVVVPAPQAIIAPTSVLPSDLPRGTPNNLIIGSSDASEPLPRPQMSPPPSISQAQIMAPSVLSSGATIPLSGYVTP